MIQVTIGTNTDKHKVTVDPAQTLRQVLEDNDVNYGVARVHLDGGPLNPGDLDKSFAQLGITETCYLIAVVKADNAA